MVDSQPCSYSYRLCDGGMGYAIGTRFESLSNTGMYTTTGIPFYDEFFDIAVYEQGSCKTKCLANTGGCPATPITPTKLTGSATLQVLHGLGY